MLTHFANTKSKTPVQNFKTKNKKEDTKTNYPNPTGEKAIFQTL
jgi:hypothetical protein